MSKKTWLILGAGGHAKVIADILLCQDAEVMGFLDDNPDLSGQYIWNLPILGAGDQWVTLKPDGMVIGIGSNGLRRQLAARFAHAAPPWTAAVHPTATISDFAQIGEGTVVMAGAVINPDVVIGAHSIINTGATVDHDCKIGAFVHIAPGCNLSGGVELGDGVLLGVGSSVIPGCSIAPDVIVGAGACVTKPIEEPGIAVVGVPAKPIRRNA